MPLKPHGQPDIVLLVARSDAERQERLCLGLLV
jgi:hypothetical protein